MAFEEKEEAKMVARLKLCCLLGPRNMWLGRPWCTMFKFGTSVYIAKLT